MFKINEDNFIEDCSSNNAIIKIPETIKGISSYSFMGLEARIISFEKDCQIEENSFVELSNLEVLDCRNFSNYKNLLDIESCFANCPMDICLIVKDNYMRSLLKESIKKFLIFTEFEFYEEGLKDTWEFKDLFETLSTFVEGKYYKLLRLSTTKIITSIIEKCNAFNIEGLYIPDYFDGCYLGIDNDVIFSKLKTFIPTIKYIKFPRVLEDENSNHFGNMKDCEIERIHLSRDGWGIPNNFLLQNNIEFLYIPSNYTWLSGFEYSNLKEITFEDFSYIERVDSTFAFSTPYMKEEEKKAKKRNQSIFFWKDVALRFFDDNIIYNEVQIPNKIRIIANNFCNSHYIKLSKLELGEDVTFIGNYAFAYQTNLKEINLPKSLKKIFESAFEDNRCHYLDIPNSVEYIGKRAFFIATKLWLDEAEDFPRTINCPKFVKIEEKAFSVEVEELPFN